jgi:hypothetical protein
MLTAVQQVLHGFNLIASIEDGVRCSTRLECFILCPNGSVQDLKDSFFGFGGQE